LSGTTSGACELNGANDSVLGVNEFKTFKVEVANLEALAEAEVVNVDNQTFGNVSVDGFNFELLHREAEFTTGFHTFGVADKFHGHFDHHGFLVRDFEEVEVEDAVFNGVELDVLEDSHFHLAVVRKFNSEDVGSVNKFANGVVSDNEVSSDKTFVVANFNDLLTGLEFTVVGEFNDFATIEDGGDFTFSAEGFGCFLAEVGAGFGSEFKSVHSLRKINVLLKIKLLAP
jgi:hypothetical protein